jgi:glycosyltransferase involved in cell wall biosynthesis
MRIIVASTVRPFTGGGGSFIAEWLEKALRSAGHEVELLRLPFHSDSRTMPAQMVGMRLIDLTGTADRVVAIRTPSYLVRHPHKVVWFIHHHRLAYDMWNSAARDVADDAEGREHRRMIMHADQVALAESAAVFANSMVMQRRLRTFNGIDAEVLYPPLPADVPYRCDDYGDALVMVSRITAHKRQLLAVQAMRHVRSRACLVLAGEVNDPVHAEQLRREIEEHGLQDRVSVLDRWISESEKVDLLARSRAVVYVPVDEDSYGYTALEAAASAKAVVTTTDSGGVLELVVDGVNGLVVPPEPIQLAQAFDRLYDDADLASRLGGAAPGRVRDLGVSWQHVLDRLLA